MSQLRDYWLSLSQKERDEFKEELRELIELEEELELKSITEPSDNE